MATKKMNVLVYSGNGTTIESVRHCLYTLRRLLSPAYAVIPVTSDVLLKEPWHSSCALLVVPGGADLAYCRTFNGEGNRRISQYVNMGGSYLGFCAGGYYGSARCEFEVDDPKMAVEGERELGFFPGTCRGLAFEGFVYNSEKGARAADLKIHKDASTGVKGGTADTFKSYYNGGGVFVNAAKLKSRGVEILASYTEDLRVDSGEGTAAIVYRKIGDGHTILTGPHPEFAPANLHHPSRPTSHYTTLIAALTSTEATRTAFMRHLLAKLGLKVNEEVQRVPSLSRLHLSSYAPVDVAKLVESWAEVFTVVDGEEYVKGENDVFKIERGEGVFGKATQELKKAVEGVLPDVLVGNESGEAMEGDDDENSAEDKTPKTKEEEIRSRVAYTTETSPDQIIDYDKIIKSVVPHSKGQPSQKETPLFNHTTYYTALAYHHSLLAAHSPIFGTIHLYGQTVTSTNTLLEKNPTLLRHLPTGFTLTATTQVAGRGRGSNVWVAPPGVLAFSVVIHHGFTLMESAPITFIQYIAALASVRGIKGYGPGYDKIPVKLKWPNDIYVQLPGSTANPLVKIGGILVNSSYSGSSYGLVVGIGLNVANTLPTTSLDQLAASANPPLGPFSREKLLASMLAHFESLYNDFCQLGFSRDMEMEYYRHWVHTDQLVTLETHDGMKARIKGITRDWGLLLAEEVGWEDRPTGRTISLQSDGNSFDFFRGLVRRKV
ncbi:class II aaRS and biotin synthetase [Lentithecium fluviatile CBS 122367]|uniref:Class II aaRS and biotin synthetase n=1 Tax=Lentithecium fluviatile CBS 122367 TaxID=1168545 RepID=A0A6G1JAK4_9PLEO|nr:class II aaRS and biotin synthetase [Lentithecium fluviatile CBS 122367]